MNDQNVKSTCLSIFHHLLENRALVEAGLTKLRSWEEALREYLTAKGHISPAA